MTIAYMGSPSSCAALRASFASSSLKSVTYEFFGLSRHLNEPGGITGYDAAAFSIIQSSVYYDKMLFETLDLQITSEIVYVAL